MIIKKNQAIASLRRIYGTIVGTDGITRVTTKAGSAARKIINGLDSGNWTATLTHIGSGEYYVELTQAETDMTEGDVLSWGYKDIDTAEAVVERVQVRLTAGSGITFTLPVLEASVYSGVARQHKEIPIVRKSSVLIPFVIKGGDYTAWTPWFAVKQTETSTVYLISPKACGTMTYDAANNLTKGTVPLTVVDTTINAIERAYAEILLKSGDDRYVPLKFKVSVLQNVIE